MYNTKAQAYKAAKKVLERLNNKNWQIVIYGTSCGYDYELSFHKGLLTLMATEDGEFFCLFTFDDSSPGTGDTRFSSDFHSKDPNAVVENMMQQVRAAVDKEVHELDVVNDLLNSPKRRQPW
jgi:hypothetical protein